MARKTKLVTIMEDGRDQGKGFLITEMPAMQAEKWAARALSALAASGVDLGNDFDPKEASAAKLVAIGIEAFGKAKWELIEPLLDEMMKCVMYVPKPENPGVLLPMSSVDNCIEEVKTLLTLRKEIMELHVGFSLAGRSSSSAPDEGQK